MNKLADRGLPACLDSDSSAWEYVYRMKKAGHLPDGAEVISVHRYLLACCRRIWPLIPHAGSRKGIEAGEKYCRGETTWEEARRTDWHSEASAFLFGYSDDNDPEVASYIAQVAKNQNSIERLLVPTGSYHEQSVKDLLTNAAYFANFALNYPGCRLGKNSRNYVQNYGKFMPLELFDAVVPGIASQ